MKGTYINSFPGLPSCRTKSSRCATHENALFDSMRVCPRMNIEEVIIYLKTGAIHHELFGVCRCECYEDT